VAVALLIAAARAWWVVGVAGVALFLLRQTKCSHLAQFNQSAGLAEQVILAVQQERQAGLVQSFCSLDRFSAGSHSSLFLLAGYRSSFSGFFA